jgi:hypothetical protein
VPRGDIDDAVGVDVEGDLDLRLAHELRISPTMSRTGQRPFDCGQRGGRGSGVGRQGSPSLAGS